MDVEILFENVYFRPRGRGHNVDNVCESCNLLYYLWAESVNEGNRPRPDKSTSTGTAGESICCFILLISNLAHKARIS